MKIGVLGGTFDPVHLGHLKVAAEVRKHLNLTKVIFVPAGQPWLDKAAQITSAEHRIAMVRLAITDKAYFELSNIEIDELPSNTVDTIAELLAELSPSDELYLIVSWDTLSGLAKWWEPWRLINMCRLVAVPRPGYTRPDLQVLENSIPGISRQVIIMEKPEIDISSSTIREMVARGKPVDHLVPGPVGEYIREHKLYVTK